MKTPKLKKVNLKNIDRHGSGRIDTKKTYIAKINNYYFMGHFSKQWYGLNFEDGWGASGHTFDPPSTREGKIFKWEGLWELKTNEI